MIKRSIQFYLDSFKGLSKDIWFLALIMLINRSGTMVIPFLTVYLTAQLEFSYVQAGIVMSCFGLGSVLGTYAGGILTDKIGYHRIMFSSLFFAALVFFCLAFVKSFLLFCLTVFLLSTIADSFRPANLSAISTFSKPENYTRSLSLIRLAINLGFAAGPAVGGLLAGSVGYEWLFIINGSTVMMAAFAIFFFLPQKKDDSHHSIEEEEVVSLRKPYQDRIFLIFLSFMLLSIVAFFQLLSTIPVFLKEVYLFDESQIGLLMGMNGLLITFLEMPIIFGLEKKIKLLYLVAGGIVLMGLGFVCYGLGSWAGWAVIGMIALTFGEIICFPFSNTFAVTRSGIKNRGQYMGWFAMMFSTAFVISPLLGMNVVEIFGWDTLWTLMIVLCAVGALGVYFLKEVVDRETEEILAKKEEVLV